jgi:hypothetical protein
MYKTHGHTTGGWSKTYATWVGMRSRCDLKSQPNWEKYGGTGITVCEKWQTFEGFLEDMGKRPEGKTLDRLDPTKGYFKENCRWATGTEQNFNARLRCNNTSGYKGVSWKKQIKRWIARGVENKLEVLLYCGPSKEAAIIARKEWESSRDVR